MSTIPIGSETQPVVGDVGIDWDCPYRECKLQSRRARPRAGSSGEAEAAQGMATATVEPVPRCPTRKLHQGGNGVGAGGGETGRKI